MSTSNFNPIHLDTSGTDFDELDSGLVIGQDSMLLQSPVSAASTSCEPGAFASVHSEHSSSGVKDNTSSHVTKRSHNSESSSSGRDSSHSPRKKAKEAVTPVAKEKPVTADVSNAGKSKKEAQEEERLKMQLLVSNFSEDQLNRYEMFRRAAFPKAAVKRLMQMVTATSVSQNVVIAMSGIAKVFVGEIVETALDIMEEWSETGPIQPKHLREAVRRIKLKSSIPDVMHHHRLFI